ncbi:MAG: succinate dehydrogenase cytochrome b subunit [Planctomycetota bacterium]
MNVFLRFYRTTVGMKQLMAITGLGLVLFLVGHLSGNLLVFKGQEAMNAYAAWLKSQGPLLWVARLGLLAVFSLHVYLGVVLKRRSARARPVPYQYDETLQATWTSRSMVLTGLLVLGFVLFHLAHFTLGASPHSELLDAQGRHNVFAMVVRDFGNPLVVLIYLGALGVLAAHLSHGISSLFQTLGLTHPHYATLIRRLGLAAATILFLGYATIPLAIAFGFVKASAA